MKTLLRITSLLTNPSNVEEIMQKILDDVVDALGFDQGIIRMCDGSRQFLETRVVKNYKPEEAKRAFSVAINLSHDCVASKVYKTGQAMVIEDVSTDPRMTETDRLLTRLNDRGSIFCAPLKIGNVVFGITATWCRQETSFFPEMMDLFLTFANQMSIIIHNAQLFDNNAEKIRQLTVLGKAVSEMNSSYVLDNHIREVLTEAALDISSASKALFYIIDDDKNRFLIHDGKQVTTEEKQLRNSRIEPSIIPQAISSNAIVVKQPPITEDGSIPIFDGLDSELAIPLHIGDKFRGALYLAKERSQYTPDQINVLDILVKNACTAYDNSIMHSLLSREAKSLKTEVEKLKEREDFLLGFDNIIGTSTKMAGIFHVIKEVAGHNTPVLIQGESGTGKELIARAIHRQSNRNTRAFVDVNCAAIPGTLLESELFGYEAGAFTDARKKKIGLLDYANGGTMLLDEIGDMSFPLQAKFLRVLEEGHIRRLGGTENIPIDVRFVFSTNKDLSKMVNDGLFREDLYYRISVVPIVLPPLRERGEDILLLAKHYVREFNKKFRKKVRGFSKEAEQILLAYRWAGNVRELKNIMERVMILQNVGTTILPENLPAEMRAADEGGNYRISMDTFLPNLTSGSMDYTAITEEITNKIKGKILERALEMSRGRKSEAAKLLNISRYKLIREQKKSGIS
ncbi:sigma-54-dependent Fis family transcriptional regulator [Syntrophus gentianae]|uniref:sigma-54-dependent Fis family transcriptional regulator n=1 Tax=Syntrophus gentianae TaxID=43775 RepID=UPI00158766BF|nr:sigma 54-interacting transcriptional regulator [Syntrophus gentianae]